MYSNTYVFYAHIAAVVQCDNSATCLAQVWFLEENG